jgi:hypothetical protein
MARIFSEVYMSKGAELEQSDRKTIFAERKYKVYNHTSILVTRVR